MEYFREQVVYELLKRKQAYEKFVRDEGGNRDAVEFYSKFIKGIEEAIEILKAVWK